MNAPQAGRLQSPLPHSEVHPLPLLLPDNRAYVSGFHIVNFAASFRRSLKPLIVASMIGGAALARGQLPPPDLVLSQPRAALLTLGPLDVHARAVSSVIYDDNLYVYDQPRPVGGIQTGATREQLGDDFIFTFSPGLQLTKPTTLDASRTALSMDYSPGFVFFLENDDENSVDHNASLKAGYALTKLTINIAQDWASTRGSVADVGSRVSQVNYNTSVNLRYELTAKTFLLMDGIYRIADYETLRDSEEWSTTTTANYQVTPKTTLGVGVTVGQLFVSEETRRMVVRTNPITSVVRTNFITMTGTRPQTYVGPTIRASYQTTEKTDVSLSFGGEWRTYDDGSSSFGPVFSLTGSYRPFETTTFSIEAHRREENSVVLSGENFISTGASLAVRQKIRQRLSAHASFSYDNRAYKAARRGVDSGRSDDYFLLRYGLDVIVGRSWTIGVFHQHRDNTSSDDRFSFASNQVGIQAAWGY